MIRGLVLAAGLAVLVANSAAQTVNYGDGGEPKVPLVKNRFDGALYVMVVIPNAPLLSDATDSSPRMNHPTSFREVFQAFKEDRTKQFYLVRTKSEPYIWGWIRKDNLLYDVECKRSEDKNNPSFIKAVLKNNLQVSMSETVSLLTGPGSKDELEKNGLAEILYVFDQKKGSDGVNYLLLGWDAEWDPDRPNESIRGWVRKDQCTIWDHRIAVYYNRKNVSTRKPVRIYRTLADLKATDERPPLAVEAGGSNKSLTYDRARFPVLQYGPAMKIAFIGVFSKNLRISLDKAHVTVEKARNMQVLFLIDGTISMGKYFQQVQRAVRDYIQTIPSDQERARLHFAVAVYRDYEDGENGEMELIADFDDPKALERLGTLKERSSPDDHTLEEAVFNGIIRSTKKVSWDKGMLKSVIVIGDHPNHPVDPRGYTVQSVVKSIETQMSGGLQSGFRFNAVNVNVTSQYRRLNDEFVSQMRQIGTHFKPAGRFEQVVNDNGDLNEFRRSVTTVLRNILETSEKVSEVLTKFEQGQTANEVAPRYGTELADLAINLLRESGIRPEVINQAGITQISQEGWVNMTASGEQQVEPWVYIERQELDEFRGFLASLLRSSDQKQRASQIVKDAVSRATGDPLLAGETVADYVKRAFALPFRGDSTILSRTPEQLQQALSDQSFWSQFRKRIGYSYEVLGLVATERDPSALRWDEVQNKWVITAQGAGDFRSWVTSAGGERFCWIPFEYLP